MLFPTNGVPRAINDARSGLSGSLETHLVSLIRQGHVEHLAFVRHCRALDIPLTEVRRLLTFVERPAQDCDDIDHLIDEQLARVRARLKSMRALERQLAQLRKRCNAGHTAGECGILHELVAAAHGEASVCHGSAPTGGRVRNSA
jgi:hypothetical protein